MASEIRQPGQDSLLEYMAVMSPTLPQPDHVVRLADALEAVERGDLDRLMVFMPPRHQKSVTVSEHFPPWYLGRNPDRRVILCSYAADLAHTFSAKARNQFDDERYPFHLSLREDSSAKHAWDIRDHRGGMIAAGIGGPITGKGGNLAIIDDPFKNRAEAESQTIRQSAWDWYTSTLYTRLEKPNAVILCMTRWHEDDLAGRLLNATGEFRDKWHVIKFKAVDESGTRLWPEKFNYDQIKGNVGSRDWNALYQQDPIPSDGVFFRKHWLRTFSAMEDKYLLGNKTVNARACRVFATVDLAFTAKQTSDFTCVSVWAQTPDNDLLLLACIRRRMESTEVLQVLHEVFDNWRPSYMLIEHASFVSHIITDARKSGLPIREVIPDKDKQTRALPAAARMEMGTIYFRDKSPETEECTSEVLSFPSGVHDDFVDTLAYAALEVLKRPVKQDKLAGLPAMEAF